MTIVRSVWPSKSATVRGFSPLFSNLVAKVPRILWSDPDFMVEAAEKASKVGRMEITTGIIYRASLPFLSSLVAQKIWRMLVSRKQDHWSLILYKVPQTKSLGIMLLFIIL